jgi:hypothetical protein
MGVSADLSFDNNLDIGYVGGVGPVTVVTTPGFPFVAAVTTPVALHAAVDSIGPVGPVTVAGIPDKFTIDVNVDKLPKIQVGLDPISIKPVDLNISLKEIPSVRAHLPADFNLGLSILGLELMCLKLCGEAQIITEPYVANTCERCGSGRDENSTTAQGVYVSHGQDSEFEKRPWNPSLDVELP